MKVHSGVSNPSPVGDDGGSDADVAEAHARESKAASGRRLVYFAAERTVLSWVRTALGLMAFGFAVDRIELFLRYQNPEHASAMGPLRYYEWMGLLLVLSGLAMLGVSAVRYFRFELRYRRENRTDPGAGLTQVVMFILLIAVLVCLLTAAFMLSVR